MHATVSTSTRRQAAPRQVPPAAASLPPSQPSQTCPSLPPPPHCSTVTAARPLTAWRGLLLADDCGSLTALADIQACCGAKLAAGTVDDACDACGNRPAAVQEVCCKDKVALLGATDSTCSTVYLPTDFCKAQPAEQQAACCAQTVVEDNYDPSCPQWRPAAAQPAATTPQF